MTLESIGRFEDVLIDDAAVFVAHRVAGDVDYRMSTSHAAPTDAAAWLAAMCANPDVAKASHAPVRQLFGHGLEGVALTAPVERGSRRARGVAAKSDPRSWPAG